MRKVKMTEQLSPEERSRRYQAYVKRHREEEKKREHIRRLVINSGKHDRKICNCDGCMWWWRLIIVMNKQGQFTETLPNIKFLIDKKGVPLYMRDFILQLRRVEIGRSQPLWIAYNAATNRKLVYNEI